MLRLGDVFLLAYLLIQDLLIQDVAVLKGSECASAGGGSVFFAARGGPFSFTYLCTINPVVWSLERSGTPTRTRSGSPGASSAADRFFPTFLFGKFRFADSPAAFSKCFFFESCVRAVEPSQHPVAKLEYPLYILRGLAPSGL